MQNHTVCIWTVNALKKGIHLSKKSGHPKQ